MTPKPIVNRLPIVIFAIPKFSSDRWVVKLRIGLNGWSGSLTARFLSDYFRLAPTTLDAVKNPLVLPLLALAAGIFASHVLVLDLRGLGLALTVSVVLGLLARWRARRLIIPCGLLAATLAGAMLEAGHSPGRPPEIDAGAREVVLLNGCVVSPPAFYEGRDQFTVELASQARAQVSMIIRDGETPPDFHYGQMVEFEARIRPTRNFQNPGAFDYEAYLARSNIYWTAPFPPARV